MRSQLGELFFLSRLEKGRLKEPQAKAYEIVSFESLVEHVAHTLKEPNLVHTQTVAGTPMLKPTLSARPFADENLLKKLIQFRDQIPVSHRIIRTPRS